MSRTPESRPRPDAGAPPPAANLPDPSRRRLFRGAAGGGAVLLATQARTALGQTLACESPSARFSGNASAAGAPQPCTGGRSPGFWKQPQHFLYWDGVTPATTASELEPCMTGLASVKLHDIRSHGTTMRDLGFANAPSSSPDHNDQVHPPGVWAVLTFPTEYGVYGQLMRHLAAAWLNASYYGRSDGYPVSHLEILRMWAARDGLYCPASAPGCAGWTRDEVIFYIASLWDDFGADDPNLCKKNP